MFTSDEAPPSPLDLCRHYDARRGGAGPHETCTCLDREHVPTRHVGGACGREHGDVVIIVQVHHIVLELTLSLFRAQPSSEWLDI